MRSSDDIFQLLMVCDATVLAYWSTAMIEAAIAKVPMIFVNIRPTVSPALLNFSEKGFCKVVCNRKEIFDALSGLTKQNQDTPLDEHTLEFYLGKRDGNATARVTDDILSKCEILDDSIRFISK